MIKKIKKEEIVNEVIKELKKSKEKILATRFKEKENINLEYEKTVKELKRRGVVFVRKTFTFKKININKQPFHRMILIDKKTLFFGIPKKEGYTFLKTKNKILIEAYSNYHKELL